MTLHVFAAASLTESFTTLGQQFEKDHPGTKVALNFGPSSGLSEQIGQGAPSDVFASASPSNMDTLVAGGDAKDPKDFAKNSMEIATPPDNPAKIASVDDLAKKGVKVALCQAQVPCGKVAAEVFSNAKITVQPVTEEVDVKSVLTKVSLGEVDAGVVYVTDVRAAGDKVKGVEIPERPERLDLLPDRQPSKDSEAREGGAGVRRPGALRRRRRRCCARSRLRSDPDAPAVMTRTQRTPWPLGVPALVGALLLVVPLVGLLVRAPWGGLTQHPRHRGGARRPLALAVLRDRWRCWSRWCSACRWPGCWPGRRCPGCGCCAPWSPCRWCCPRWSAASPCCSSWAARGWSVQHLDAWFGITIPFTTAAVVIAETFVAMPFLVIAVEGAFRSADQGYDEAAATLGASRLTVFRRVTLPLIRPALVAGAVLCWARALGEFGATITFAGNLQGVTRTMPLEVYLAMETDPDAAVALSLVLLAVSVGVLFALRGRWVGVGGSA